MGIWRLDLFAASMFLTMLVLLPVIALVLRVRASITSVVGRAVLLATCFVVLVLSPWLVDQLIRLRSRPGHYVDPLPGILWFPAAAVAVLLILVGILFPRRNDAFETRRWRGWFLAGALAFVLLNLMNWCQPGWCGRYGFPFAYSWWSDAILIMDGKNLSAGDSQSAIALDVGAFAVFTAALAVAYRRAA